MASIMPAKTKKQTASAFPKGIAKPALRALAKHS